jgi:ABC-type Na+ transport system ATPase subunit NatA
LIHNGKLIADGDLEALRSESGKNRLSEIFLHLVGR